MQESFGPEEGQVDFRLEDTQPAGFWIRLAAYAVDMLILIVFGVGALFVKDPGVYLILVGLLALYKPVLESFLGGTAGKLAMGLQVIDEEGRRLSIVGALVRNGIFILPTIPQTILQLRMIQSGIGPFDVEGQQMMRETNETLYLASNLLLFLVFLSCLVVAFNQRKRGLHDMMADSFVIRTQQNHD